MRRCRPAIPLLLFLASCSGGGSSSAGDQPAGSGATRDTNESSGLGPTSGAANEGPERSAGGSSSATCACVDGSAPEPRRDAGTPTDAGTETSNGASACAFAGAAVEGKYVANHVALPGLAFGGVPFGRDLNGDGTPDNAYGAVAMHYGQSFNWQSAMDSVIASGRMLLLFDVMASDATFTTSACATVNLSRAQSSSDPTLDGTDALAVDTQRGQAILRGSIVSSVLDADVVPSNMPRVTLMLPLGPPVASTDGGTTLSGIAEVPVTVVHASFTAAGSGLSNGQINGFISADDLRYALVPALAANLTALATVHAGSTGAQILQTFDTGGTPDPSCADACRDDDGACSVAGDGIISSCEVATSSSGRNLLVPDVRMLAADGRYAPNPDNAEPDSFSIGLGFTAVRAAF